ncbi:MAG: ribosomal protein S18-alanine N-acetyltransferase [Chloroflexota bacterium]|nr:ribosomal protein S18-alanine N-acetyltransferase [Chloroflexota bacterium]
MTIDPGLSQLNLRPMTMSDLDEVLEIESASFPTPWPRDAFLHEIKHAHQNICWVAEYAPEKASAIVVGYIVIWLIRGTAHIANLSVKLGFRKRGIGQYILANALLTCVDADVQGMMLEVRASNVIAQKLYQKIGFEVIEKQADYYKDTHEDALVMMLSPLNRKNLADLANYG